MDDEQTADETIEESEKFIFDQEIVDAFINEVREHLEEIEQDFLTLENQANDPDQYLIDKTFRAIHSIKGSAGFMQLTKISDLTHLMEALLQKMRAGEIRPESKYIEVLISGCDLLNEMIVDIRESEKTDIRDIQQELSALLKNSTPTSSDQICQITLQEESPEDEAHGENDGENYGEKDEKNEKNEENKENKDDDDDDGEDNDGDDGEDDSYFDQEMFDIFVEESKEHLDGIEEDFLILENQATHPDPELIDRVFRAIHSIKGGAGMLGLKKASKLSHTMEALLQKMRSKDIYPETRYIEALLSGCDLLIRMTDNIRESEKMEIRDVHRHLSELLDYSESDSESKPEPKSDPELPKESLSDHPDSKSEPAPELPEESLKEASASVTKVRRDHSETVRIKVDLLNLLMTLAGELVLVRNQQLLMADDLDPTSRSISQRMDMVTTQLQEAIMRTRMQPVGNLFSKLPRIVRDISKKVGKDIQLYTSGDEVELDKTILESLSDPLTHIIRNACDHGIEMPEERYRIGKPETGTVNVNAFHEAGQINIVIRDDGKGIDPRVIRKEALKRGLKTDAEVNRMGEREILSLIMMPGFSTSETTTEISGRGVGMDVVKSSVEQQGGSIEMTSEKGEGTVLHLRLPLTLAIIPCLIVEIGEERYAIPKVSVDELVCLYDDEIFTGIEYAGVQEVCRLRDALLPVVRMKEILDRPEKFTEEIRAEITEKYSQMAKAELEKGERIRQSLLFAVVKIGMHRFGLVVDRVMGSEEIVVNPIHPKLKSLDIYSGVTIMGDGTVALILDIHGIAIHTGVEFISDTEKSAHKGAFSDESDTQRVLIFKNGPQERFAVPLPMIRRVQDILIRDIEIVGSKEYITIDGVSTLILRLDRLIDVSDCVEKDEMYLLLPRHTSRPFGILMSALVDVISVPLILNEESHIDDGILGTAIVQDRMTLFPDIYYLFEKTDPRWNTLHSRQISGISQVPRQRILLVEDTVFFRRLVEGYLRSAYEVETAENGAKALEILGAGKTFDLIVSDIEMPEMDGWAFLKQVRSNEIHKDTPAVALTTLDSPEDRAKMERVGFNAYEKKIDRERLLTVVTELLHGERSEF